MSLSRVWGRCPGWCGLCYANRRGRANYSGHYGYRVRRPLEWESVSMVLRRRDVAASSGSEGQGPVEDGFSTLYPNVWEMVSSSAYPDGSRRVMSTLLLFCDGGLVKACLNDRDQGLTAWCSGESVSACLRTLETGLAGDTLEWRKPVKGGARKK